MKIVRSNFFAKPNDTINSVVRNSSCSRGWLRLVVQSIFGTITVLSFVLIVHMAVARPPVKDSACAVSNCRIMCGQEHFDDTYAHDILIAVLDIRLHCQKIDLQMSDVHFTNGTLPTLFLSRLPSKIERLHIIAGNLQHIPPTAFSIQVGTSLRELVLEKITLSSWTPDTFVALNNLNSFSLRDCNLPNIERNALKAVDETIEILSVINSGRWDPSLLTGSTHFQQLKHVYLSENYFGNIIDANTFKGLSSCIVLFLNSCKITSIGADAFDAFQNLKLLLLNDNYLVTLPPGLFSRVLVMESSKPRILLQNNRWHCDCNQNDIMYLSKKGFLLVDPVCHGPKHMNGKSISYLQASCNVHPEEVEIIYLKHDSSRLFGAPNDMFNRPCFHGKKITPNSSLKVITPSSHLKCRLSRVGHFETLPRGWTENTDIIQVTDVNWLHPTFLIQNSDVSMMQIGSSVTDGYGLVWHQSSCPNEAYCVSEMPNILRVYNVIMDTEFTFCPIDLMTANIQVNQCIRYSVTNNNTYSNVFQSPVLYILTGFLSILFGALVVYGLIRLNPSLLKGSKRLLFVKHRDVDALVLPPKIPVRNSLSSETNISLDGNKIFTVFDDDNMVNNNFLRSHSMRSDKSITPTYVSAMQPTEAQLAEWRIRNHFDHHDSIISICSESSKFSWMPQKHRNDDNCTIAYESLT